MLLKSKRVMAVAMLALGLFAFGCADDEEPEPVVEPEPMTQEPDPIDPDPAPMPSFSPETIYFAFDDYTLNMDAQNRLSELAEYLKSNQGEVVQVEGHCDERGSTEYNLALGDRRAESVRNYLVQLGVDPARLSTISYGEEKPAVPGSSESSWAKNRRAEFVMSAN